MDGGLRIDTAEGPAARAGLKAGDVILSANNAEVKTVKQFQAALAKVEKGKSLQMLVRRGEVATYVVLKPGKG